MTNFFLDFVDQLPPFIFRGDISKYFPWLTSARMRHLDSLGQGPPRLKQGKFVIYPTREFLVWLDARSEHFSGSSEDTEHVRMNLPPKHSEGKKQSKPRRGRPRKVPKMPLEGGW